MLSSDDRPRDDGVLLVSALLGSVSAVAPLSTSSRTAANTRRTMFPIAGSRKPPAASASLPNPLNKANNCAGDFHRVLPIIVLRISTVRSVNESRPSGRSTEVNRPIRSCISNCERRASCFGCFSLSHSRTPRAVKSREASLLLAADIGALIVTRLF